MKFLLYLLKCLPEGISAVLGHTDLVTNNIIKLIIGCLEVILIVGLYVFLELKIFYNHKHKIILSIVSLIGIILIFAIMCIIIEFIINIFK